MQDWWTYSLSDFLLFSPRTYYRLLELYNAAIWPAHIVAFVLGLTAAALIWRRQHTSVVWLLLASLWLWVAYAFHLEHYATINWAATYFAIAFALEAALLVLYSGRTFDPQASTAGLSGLLLVVGTLAYPVIAIAIGRPIEQAEVFGIAPDPTAFATIAVLLTATRTPLIALIIPLLWLIFSTLTLIAMEAPDRWILVAFTAMSAVLVGWRAIAR